MPSSTLPALEERWLRVPAAGGRDACGWACEAPGGQGVHPAAFEALARLLGHHLPRAGLSRPGHAGACRPAEAEPMETPTWQEASTSSCILP